jgi:pimeloyl-ACP methyl ester carboxylesterase
MLVRRMLEAQSALEEMTMVKLSKVAILASALLASSSQASAEPSSQAQSSRPSAARGQRVAVNGIDYYYELHGAGEPLLLLHGGLGTIGMFGPVLTELAQNRLVIAVDLQGHGRTPLGARPFRLESIADDMAELLVRIGHPHVDVMGYSLGGGVGLRLALQKPARVRKLVLVSTTFSDDGYYADIRAQQRQISRKLVPQMKSTPMYRSYVAVAPKPADFPRLLDAVADFMRQKYDWSAELSKLTAPVMLVYGDSDTFKPEHEIEFYRLLGGGRADPGWHRENMPTNRLAILPDMTHYEIFCSPRLVSTVLPFLSGASKVKSPAEQVREAR